MSCKMYLSKISQNIMIKKIKKDYNYLFNKMYIKLLYFQ